MARAKSKALVPKQSNFLALSPALQESADDLFSPKEIKDSMGKQSMNDLEKIKVPSGGTTSWEVIGKNGEEEMVKALEVVVVAAQDVRVFYATKYSGGNEPPDCASLDCITGIVGENAPEEITGDCASCPKSQWGSAVDEDGNPTDGKACNERKMCLIYRPEDMVPIVLSIPPSSLKEVSRTFSRIAVARHRPYWGCVFSLTLSKEKNKRGIVYSQVQASFVRDLTAEEVAVVRDIREQFVPTVDAIAD